MHIFFRVWRGLSKLSFLNIVLASLVIILTGTLVGYWVEPETFPSLFDSFWWTMTTLTTVGYGDFFPSSVAGRWLGIFLFLFGIGIIGALIGKLVEVGATFQRLKREGKLMYRGEGHYVYIGWSPKTKKAIDEVLGQGVTLMAVNDRLDYATVLDTPLEASDMLYVVCHDDTWERLNGRGGM
ncbi:potassium channel family protein [Exiguobacterium aurantiacum]|uniref:MlotiK1 channel n=1 Tax=Exiguobacterium aurantiacum TaxID=33987 RepID=A0A377FRD3_9BACL|nr:potassium channel family protein [Exiguobacterium aurantiacum]STO07036.1 MlotiK1 channel [Exiguobacterium aurantiacum]